MLVGKNGIRDKPTHPCIVPGCETKSLQEIDGACKDHMFDKIEWLKRRLLTRKE